MKIVVTGATGFVGRHFITQLLSAGHEIIAVARDSARFNEMVWRDRVRCISCDIHSDLSAIAFLKETPDSLVHLAWPGLPNYKNRVHYERYLPADYKFLKSVVEHGIKHVLVTGTGAEYGLQSGCLAEDAPTSPVNAYGIAKDSLRRYMQNLQSSYQFTLQWVRLFHMYGSGQNPGSLLAQLDKAINGGATSFDMSAGEQLRDYLPIEEVARRLALLVKHPECGGVINCCSGTPISVRRLVEDRLKERGVSMALNLGHYPYPDYETMAYWGNPTKLLSALGGEV